MSTRPSAPRGVLLAGVGAFAALVSLWLPWYTIRLPEAFRDAIGAIGSGGSGTGSTGSAAAGGTAGAFSGLFKGLAAALPSEITGKGWQVMSGGDVAIAVAAGAALLLIVAVAGGASGVRIERGIAGRLIALAGAVVTGIAVEHVISKGGGGAGNFSSIVQVKYGIAVAAAGGLLMMLGGLLTTRAQADSAEPMTPTFEPPQPAAAPDPFAAPVPGQEEHTVSDPFAAPTPDPQHAVDPFADPVPQPQTAFDPFADPPAPEPEGEPRFVLDSDVEPQVVLDRDPFADPEPQPEPELQVVLDRDPFADPEPAPAPEVVFDADPFAVPEPVAAPEPVLGADPFADPEPIQEPEPEPYQAQAPVAEPVAYSPPKAPAEAEPRDWSGFTTPVPIAASESPAHAGAEATTEPTVARPAGVSIPPPGWTGAA